MFFRTFAHLNGSTFIGLRQNQETGNYIPRDVPPPKGLPEETQIRKRQT